jgi:hypothetical protein
MEEHAPKVLRMTEARKQFINPTWRDAHLPLHHDSLLPMVFP